VDFASFQLFRDIAQTRSITRGAELNGITASAASQHLHELERTLGSILLDRTVRPITLTPSGRLYAELCRDILRRKEEFEAALDQMKSSVEGTVRVASIYSVGLSEMSELEAEFQKRIPGAKLHIDYLRPEKVYDYVLSDRSDIGLVSYPEQTREISVIPWRNEEMVVAMAAAHPLARRESIEPFELEGIDFVAFDEDLPIRREVDRYLRANSVSVSVVMQFDNLQTIRDAVVLGSGVSIVPGRILRSDLEQGRMAAVPIASPGLYRPLGIVHRKRKKFHKAAAAFLELLQSTPEPSKVPVFTS
jgi:LysR family transcriptional regulator, transcriptional activator of the cysJI operon